MWLKSNVTDDNFTQDTIYKTRNDEPDEIVPKYLNVQKDNGEWLRMSMEFILKRFTLITKTYLIALRDIGAQIKMGRTYLATNGKKIKINGNLYNSDGFEIFENVFHTDLIVGTVDWIDQNPLITYQQPVAIVNETDVALNNKTYIQLPDGRFTPDQLVFWVVNNEVCMRPLIKVQPDDEIIEVVSEDDDNFYTDDKQISKLRAVKI